jgi:hypothetical protein
MLVGQILTVLVIATVLAVLSALLVARLYRTRMKRLMQAPVKTPPMEVSAPSGQSPHKSEPAIPLTLADNQRAYRRLLASLLLLSLVMALTRTLIAQVIAHGPISLKSVAALGAAYAWPVLPVLAVIGRWSRWRFVGAIFAWFLLAVPLMLWRTNENVSTTMILMAMGADIGLPLIVVSALCLGGATRAVGPWLTPLLMLVCASSMLGMALLTGMVNNHSPVLFWLFGWLSANSVTVLFVLLPWLLVWWPARWLGRWLARAYHERRISELLYLFTAVWVIALIEPALGASFDLGWGALVCFAPLLWIPVGAALMRRSPGQPTNAGRPPTLLVLRVFQQDRNVQDLFDRVIERWRLSGNTVLIAGTDLLERTVDAEDIFTFIDGRLGERFIQSASDVPRRLADFDWQADMEGRFRVNECYCHDTTWQQALVELVHVSDVVLMDLRNFMEQNKGCLHELQVLATSPGLRRVVVLINAQTQLPVVQAVASQASDNRFVWLMQQGKTPFTTVEVLAPLFESPAESAA